MARGMKNVTRAGGPSDKMTDQYIPTTQPDPTGCFPSELAALIAAHGAPAFRGKQLFSWLHKRLAMEFDEMTDLPVELRCTLADAYRLTVLRTAHTAAAPDGTVKYLFTLADGHTVETVLIPARMRATVCVSTQVGCPFGCVFCATGQSGFIRNLTAAEIVQQVYRVQAVLPADRRVTNIVYMGMGEPLANYDAVLRSVRLLIHPLGLDLAQRHITLSTVGITPGIERLAEEGLQVNLALSLHAPTQAARVKLVPVAKKYDLDGLLAAVRHYVRRTGRKATFEYTVVPGGNDADADAAALAQLTRGLQCLVNVIPLNPNEGLPAGMKLSANELLTAAECFADAVRRHGAEVALRRSRGGEVTGACGQLRRRTETGTEMRKDEH